MNGPLWYLKDGLFYAYLSKYYIVFISYNEEMAGKLSQIVFMIIDSFGTICGMSCFITYLCLINMDAGKIEELHANYM